MTLSHGNFTLQRTWLATPDRIFSAWSDQNLRAQWFGGAPGHWQELRRALDFRVGGAEVLEGRLTDGGRLTYYESRFHLIEPGQRLIYAYDLHVSGQFHSVTLASLVLVPAADRTQVSYSEQVSFLGPDGTAERQHEADAQLSRLEAALHLQRAPQ